MNKQVLLLFLPLFLLSSVACGASPPDSLRAASYDSLLVRLDTLRSVRVRTYAATPASGRDSILDEARRELISAVVDSIAPFWMGTPWDFNGTTEEPGEGMIACGYFVSTLLRDAGLKVERVKMAQQASEKIVKTLATKDLIKRFRNTEFPHFIDTMRNWGAGLYVVGLDYHVGFLHHDGEKVWFIHSSYIAPKCVIREPAGSSLILAASKYRVVGKISENDELVRKWLRGERVRTGGNG